MIAKVVLVQKLLAHAQPNVGKFDLARVIHESNTSASGLPVPLGMNKKLMKMSIRPAERDLEDVVKLVNGRVASHQ